MRKSFKLAKLNIADSLYYCGFKLSLISHIPVFLDMQSSEHRKTLRAVFDILISERGASTGINRKVNHSQFSCHSRCVLLLKSCTWRMSLNRNILFSGYVQNTVHVLDPLVHWKIGWQSNEKKIIWFVPKQMKHKNPLKNGSRISRCIYFRLNNWV